MEQHDRGETEYTEARALIAKLTREEKEKLLLLLQSISADHENGRLLLQSINCFNVRGRDPRPLEEMEVYNHAGKGASD